MYGELLIGRTALITGVEICNDLKIENTICVLDPTLLLTGDELRKISTKNTLMKIIY